MWGPDRIANGITLLGIVGLWTLGGCAADSAPPLAEEVAEPAVSDQHQALHNAVPAGVTDVVAWRIFAKEAGSTWQVHAHPKTGVPQRMYGAGLPAPGSVADSDAAQTFALGLLERHVALLAPGSKASDFVLVSNHLSGGIRSVGFQQQAAGMDVLTGQVSFRFKQDRLFVIASEALPHVKVEHPTQLLDGDVARKVARDWVIREEQGVDTVRLGAVEGPFVRVNGGDQQAVVLRIKVASDAPLGRWDVFVDARDGSPVDRVQTMMFENATLMYNAPVRGPSSERREWPAHLAEVTINDDNWTATEDGLVEWVGSEQVTLEATTTSNQVRIYTDAGELATGLFEGLVDGDTAVWNAADDELVDAQINTFVHLNVAKEYARTFAPDIRWLNSQVEALVNIDDECNAVSDGTSVYFFQSSENCENTGRIADVVYHEFGHSLHNHAIIPGVGAFDGSLSEGVSDYLAATITGDPGMGPEFFKGSQRPLRHIDPASGEYVWPDDVRQGDVHHNGLIISGALWDLRKALIARYGEQEGVIRSDFLYLQGIRRASDIPTMYVELLAADDDDGDLNNGTPNVCDIVEAFARHGLASVGGEATVLKNTQPSQDGFRVELATSATTLQCATDESGATLVWQRRDDPTIGGSIAMTSDAEGTFEGWIPPQAEGAVVQYSVVLNALGSLRTYPDNQADPLYEFYVGDVQPIYCTSFDEDPETGGWEHGLARGEASEGADDWQWGTPGGRGLDPVEAYSPPHLFGNDIGPDENWNGVYQADKINFARSPVIDTQGFRRVRLQYMRWLTVEDATYDTASIYANDSLVWQNASSQPGDIHHIDREWRFHDVDLTDVIGDEGTVQIMYEIASDGGLELGGWNLDDVCIVGIQTLCGDGLLDPGEACDDGAANSDQDPGACRTTCQPAICGDGILDPGEACDDGNGTSGDGCSSTCMSEEGEGTGGGLLGNDPNTDTPANVLSSGSSGGGCSQLDRGAGHHPLPLGVGGVVLLLGALILRRSGRR